ncbi:MAG: hypothetical protein VKP63_03965 [Cyanobacteriota bacterium]|nr:hypothetical protein [Cyanobacteriota bacterium]
MEDVGGAEAILSLLIRLASGTDPKSQLLSDEVARQGIADSQRRAATGDDSISWTRERTPGQPAFIL